MDLSSFLGSNFLVLSQGWFWTTPFVGCGISFIRRRELYDFSSRSVFILQQLCLLQRFSNVTARYFIANGISVTLKYKCVRE